MESPKWLTAEFIEGVLKKAEENAEISVSELEINAASSIGENNNSKMYRVHFNVTRGEVGQVATQRRSLVVKVAHSDTQQLQKELNEDLDIFGVEINFMTGPLRDMESVLENTKLAGKCYFAQRNNPPILVLEDLGALGFKMADRQVGLDLEHCILVLRDVAKFHASSIYLLEKKPEVKELCSKGVFSENCPPTLRELFISGMKAMAKAAKSWPELGRELIEKLQNLQESAISKTFKLLKLKEDEFNVINHGDVWVNNQMFKYDDKRNVIGHIFVDFQACLYGTPALDLQYFFHTSPNEQVLINHKNLLIQEYQKTLSSTMKRIECESSAPSLEYIRKMLLEKEFYGFVIASACLPIMMASKDQAKVLDDMLDEEEFNPGAYNSEKYRVRMVRMLKEWDNLGVLDIK